MLINPTVCNKDGRVGDILSLNLENRIVMLTGTITDEQAALITSQLLYLDSVSQEPVFLYINSPGGSVSAGLAIYDTMKSIVSPVHTVCQGVAASMAAIILSGGKHGKRYILPHSEVMIHQPSTGMEGKASDLMISMNRLERIRQTFIHMLAENCGQSEATIQQSIQADYWMTAEEAISYGIVDSIITGEQKQ